MALPLEALAARINSYTGGPVTRAQVEEVLEFNILLEPRNQRDPDAATMYAARVEKWKDTITRGKEIVRQYGRQCVSFTDMQDKFYSFTNSPKYRASIYTISVATATLNDAWDGIRGWS